ncbi:hypothetical protein SAMN05421736_10810 [Evansella caseinilytica]|uniref:Uncharacterized protein n=1 Tax=Evansella caseinilytica TaxID=1503961 RepID=A0A1H3RB88_9BACI|nr:hypothetical protein SAMN05421736_10810 [Evansella caseinilytica]
MNRLGETDIVDPVPVSVTTSSLVAENRPEL